MEGMNLDDPIKVMPENMGEKPHDDFELSSVGWAVVILVLIASVWLGFFNNTEQGGEKYQAAVIEDDSKTGFVYRRVGEIFTEPTVENLLLPTLYIEFEGSEAESCIMDYIDFDTFKCAEEPESSLGNNSGFVWVSDPTLYDGENEDSALTNKELYLNDALLEVDDTGSRALFTK